MTHQDPNTPKSSLQPISRASGFSVTNAEGFVTSVIRFEGDSVVQLGFWTTDASPEIEDVSKGFEDVERYRTTARTVLETSVKLRPDVALQLALNILDNLTKLPDAVREKYGLPKGVKHEQGA